MSTHLPQLLTSKIKNGGPLWTLGMLVLNVTFDLSVSEERLPVEATVLLPFS